MSMLAERKQKQRWFLNPRANKEWAQDGNKFGQRMLEKMGWSAGKGLGANEDGIKEQIKVKYKNDIQGIGYQVKDDQWTQHENNFTQLLANLGSGKEETKLVNSEKSLEKKSQNSRARVHYHKFTRGKDLARRSEKDLANIFGRKTLEKVVVKEEKAEDNEEESKKFGVLTIKSGNMTEYFKSKLNKLSDKFSSTIVKKEEDESESEIGTTAGFGFSSGSENKQNFINFVSNSVKTNEEETNSSTKENTISFVTPSTEIEDQTQQNSGIKRKREETEDVPKEQKKKNKKKNKSIAAFDNPGNDINIAEEICYDNPCLEESNEEEKREEIGLDNPAFDDELNKKNRKSVTFASPLAEYSVIGDDLPKRKKKKKKKKPELGIDNPAIEEQEEQIEGSTPTKKSKKKKRKIEHGIDNFACEETADSLEEITPKKTKKKRKSVDGVANLACEESPVNCAVNLACSVNLVEEGVESITNAIDCYQTELENEMNERKNKKLQKAQSKK